MWTGGRVDSGAGGGSKLDLTSIQHSVHVHIWVCKSKSHDGTFSAFSWELDVWGMLLLCGKGQSSLVTETINTHHVSLVPIKVEQLLDLHTQKKWCSRVFTGGWGRFDLFTTFTPSESDMLSCPHRSAEEVWRCLLFHPTTPLTRRLAGL